VSAAAAETPCRSLWLALNTAAADRIEGNIIDQYGAWL